MAPANNEFKKFNARGAITYSNFTMGQARAANERSDYPKTPEKIAPDVQLLLDEVQFERIRTHLVDVYLPEAVARKKAGEKKDAFDQKQADKIARALEERDFDGPPHLPVKKVYEKTLDLAPWAVATLKFAGTAGRDIDQQAKVTEESELLVPPTDVLAFPLLRPINETKHELYPGAWAYATLNLSGYASSAASWGISAYANTVVFLEDRDRLAGGAAGLDTEDIFLED